MAEISSIINLVNRFALMFSFEDKENSIQQLVDLFTQDATFTHELIGILTGQSEIEKGLQEMAALRFLADTRHLPSGHVVNLIDETHGEVTSYSVVFWKCTAISVVQWIDQVVKLDENWLFQSRKAESLQKNFEMIGEMQLRGKKQYLQQVENEVKK